MADKDHEITRSLPKQLQKHPLFDDEAWEEAKIEYEKATEGMDVSQEKRIRLKAIFAIANYDMSGVIGRRQFADLMEMLGIQPTDDELNNMMEEMDTDGGGSIGFDEFCVGMCNNYSDELITAAAETPIGTMGTKRWTRGEILWCCNSNIIVLCMAVCTTILVYFQMILVPLTLAYFITFLLVPLMNVFEQRPLECRGKSCCAPKEHAKRADAPEGAFITCFDLFTACKAPHAVGVLGTLGLFFGVLIFLVYLVASEMSAFMADPLIKANLEQLKQDYQDFLNDSNIIIIDPPICEDDALCKEGSSLMYGDCLSCGGCEAGYTYDSAGEMVCNGGKANQINLYKTLGFCKGAKGIDCEHDGYTMDELLGYIGMFSNFFNQFALIMLFVVYLMLEKNPNEKMFKGDNACMEEVETMIDHYIGLKTMLSAATGFVVTVILLIIQIKLAVLFGIMSFVLNYIPNVGSLIAMFLPTPVVLLDPGLVTWQKVAAFAGPGAVQGYVGNVLEPTVFGASLNMTPLSILAALVMWSSVWGLPGAVLSVPMLGIQKIVMVYTNHPFAKYSLMLIREDPTLDEAKERAAAGLPGLPAPAAEDGDGGTEEAKE